MGIPFELRPATTQDEAFLRALYVVSRPDLAVLVASEPEGLEETLHAQFELQRRHYETHFPDAEHAIIVVDGTPVGRLWVDWRKDEARCLDVALLPERRSQGIGGEVVERLKARAAGRGLPCTLCVEHANAGARRFYERHGFREIKQYPGHALMEWTPAP